MRAMTGRLRLEVLGPVVAVLDGSEVALAPMQRVLLASLVVAPGSTASTSEIEAQLWEADPPPTSRNRIQVLVTQLRAKLGPVIERVPGGYRLDDDAFESDYAEFRSLVSTGGRAPRLEELASAISLWRGPLELIGIPASRAAQERLHTLEAWAELAIETTPTRAISELAPVVTQEPLRESAVGLLMRAYAAAGVPAEALRLYESTRSELVETLGASPSADLQEAFLAILRESEPVTSGVTVPHELPPTANVFVGREAEIDDLRSSWLGQGRRGLLVITGPGGVGKTALAEQLAQLLAGDHPDGEVYLNLRGFDARQPVLPVDALASLFLSLGLTNSSIPSDVDQASARLRTLAAGKRLLVVLDNVASAEQVRPLLLGGDCTVIITSRVSLSGLVAKTGAKRVALSPLAPRSALDLASALLAQQAVDEPDLLPDLVRVCGRIPLTIRIALSHLRDFQVSVSELIRDIEAAPLDVLSIGDDPTASWRAVVDQSFTGLDPKLARAFTLLSLIPGPTFSAGLAGAVLGVDEVTARQLVRALSHRHLLEQRPGGRYAFHDLIRDYATAARDSHFGDDVDDATRGLFRYVVNATVAAAGAMDRAHGRATPLPEELAVVERDAKAPTEVTANPLAWFLTERELLLGVVRQEAHGFEIETFQISFYLRNCFYALRLVQDWMDCQRHAANACQRIGSSIGVAASLVGLGQAAVWSTDRSAAQASLRTAIEILARTDETQLMAEGLSALGVIAERSGNYHDAQSYLTRAFDIFTGAGAAGHAGDVSNSLGFVAWRQGHDQEAAKYQLAAIDLSRRGRSRFGEAVALADLAQVRIDQGHFQEAEDALTASLTVSSTLGYDWCRVVALVARARLARVQGDACAARSQLIALRDQGHDWHDPDLRLRMLNELASALLDLGEIEEASTLLKGVRAEATELSLYAERERAARLLADLDRAERTRSEI
ncbi:MAG: BTAD domain-containing putative transcriptional regulator [Nocardioides sp.]|uniref:AfsR/SARP family transcriptional regulator n=1 Tax=Nocardioides sp. TaxID=35761 RepID=UPI003D6A3CE9